MEARLRTAGGTMNKYMSCVHGVNTYIATASMATTHSNGALLIVARFAPENTVI